MVPMLSKKKNFGCYKQYYKIHSIPKKNKHFFPQQRHAISGVEYVLMYACGPN